MIGTDVNNLRSNCKIMAKQRGYLYNATDEIRTRRFLRILRRFASSWHSDLLHSLATNHDKKTNNRSIREKR